MKDYKTTINIRAVKDIQKSCEAESKRRGMGGFGYPVEACSFWDSGLVNNTCTIFLSEKVNYHTLGHEMRHCIQGNFH